METPSFMQAIGLIGVAGYISCFASLQLGIIDGNGRIFTLLSIINASLVLISLIEHFNLPAVIIQITWITFGVIGLTLKTIRHYQEPKETGQLNESHRKTDRYEKQI